MMTVMPGAYFLSGFGVIAVLVWLASAVACIYAFVLLVKLARRGITALDLYNYSKNLEIRAKYESANKEGTY